MNAVDKYISKFPAEVQHRLKEIRNIILEIAPDAAEQISYGMPGYKTNGRPLVYFAGYKKHIGLYATPSGHKEFAPELARFKQGKGSVQFPLDEILPVDLIKRIVKFRTLENAKK